MIKRINRVLDRLSPRQLVTLLSSFMFLIGVLIGCVIALVGLPWTSACLIAETVLLVLCIYTAIRVIVRL